MPHLPPLRRGRRSNLAHRLTLVLLATALGIGASLPQSSVRAAAPAASQVIAATPPLRTYQTMTGWEANAELGEGFCASSQGVERYRAQVIDLAANRLGINRLRLGIGSGVENPVDHFSAQLAEGNGFLDEAKLKKTWYLAVNDDDDPMTTNPAGFQFSELDFYIDGVVLPLKRALEERGEKLFVNLTYGDFGDSPLEHKDHPEEYAELILTTFQHMQDKYGFVPDAVGVSLEPENANWNGVQLGRAMAAAGIRLQARGFHPQFVAPSTTNMGNALRYFDELSRVPDALRFLSELSYHRYAGVSEANLREIARRAGEAGVKTAMLEHVGGNVEELHQDLTVGNASAWQQFALAGCGHHDDGTMYIRIDDSDPANPKVALTPMARLYSHYFRFARLGAERIEIGPVTDGCDTVAFRNVDGGLAVVIKARGGTCAVAGLPEGTYGVVYTTASEFDRRLPDVSVGRPGESVQVSIPAAGVITILSSGL